MNGQEMEFSALVLKDRHDTRGRCGSLDVEICWETTASPSEVVSMYLSATMGEAPGENKIIGKVRRKFAISLLHVQYPLPFKTFVHLQSFLQYKGGML